MIEKPSKTQPALLGGLVIGLLWSIPYVNLLNLCCCIGVLGGGAFTAWLLIKRSPTLPVSAGDGAVVGMLAGLVGAGVYLILGVPIGLLFPQTNMSIIRSIFGSLNNPEVNRAMEEAIRSSENEGLGARVVSALVSWFIASVISIGFAAIGGLIGVALFEKRKGGQYPPQGPPPGYPPPGYPPPGEAPYGASGPSY